MSHSFMQRLFSVWIVSNRAITLGGRVIPWHIYNFL